MKRQHMYSQQPRRDVACPPPPASSLSSPRLPLSPPKLLTLILHGWRQSFHFKLTGPNLHSLKKTVHHTTYVCSFHLYTYVYTYWYFLTHSQKFM